VDLEHGIGITWSNTDVYLDYWKLHGVIRTLYWNLHGVDRHRPDFGKNRSLNTSGRLNNLGGSRNQTGDEHRTAIEGGTADSSPGLSEY
jgi:hypothetical protein